MAKDNKDYDIEKLKKQIKVLEDGSANINAEVKTCKAISESNSKWYKHQGIVTISVLSFLVVAILTFGYFGGINFIKSTIEDRIQSTVDDYETILGGKLHKVQVSERTEGTFEFEKWYDSGAGAYSNKRYEKAINYFSNALKENPDNKSAAYTHNYIGTACIPLGKLDEAIKNYDDAIRLSPEYAIAHQNRGIIYYNLGNREKAFEDFNKASDLYIIKGEYEKASKNIEGTLSLLEKTSIDVKTPIEEKINELKKKLEEAKTEKHGK